MNYRLFAGALAIAAALVFAAPSANAETTVTGSITTGSAVTLGPSAVNTTAHQVLKITLVTPTSQVALELCAGTQAQITARHCGTELGLANEVNIPSLAVVDAANLNGQFLYVLYSGGTASPAKYTVTIE